jgi:tripartite-type tricarboxylate transporter receptor subunit TctC
LPELFLQSIELAVMSPPSLASHIRNGNVKALALASEARLPTFPDIPTTAEAGLPGFIFDAWYGLFAPAGPPKPIIDKLNAEINKALVLPDVVKSLETQALDAAPSTVDQFNTALKVDYEKYGKLIKLTGAKIE